MSDSGPDPRAQSNHSPLDLVGVLVTALDSMGVGIAVLDSAFNFLLVNDAFASANGRGGDLVGKNFFALVPNEDDQEIFREVAATGRSYFVSGQSHALGAAEENSASGAAIEWDWSLQPVLTPEGQLSCLVLMQLDVTEREHAHHELAEKGQLLGQLFQLAPDANLLIDRDGLIQQANRQTLAIFGYSEAELIGQPIELLVPDSGRQRHTGLRRRFQVDPHTRPMGKHADFCARHKDGSEFPVEIMISPISTPKGEYVLSVVRDISQQRQAEAELTEMRRRLLIGAESEKTQLARELHDSAIQDLYGAMYELQLITDELSPQGQGVVTDVVETIKKVNDQLRLTIADLRPTTLISFGLTKAIRSYASRFQEAYPQIELELDLDEDVTQLTDEIRLSLYRICIQLLANAAMHAGAIKIWVRLRLNDQAAVLEVQDDGRGFVPPTRWVQFAREGRLGLIDVTERAQGMGGRMRIDSRPGLGTLVQVTVPLNQG